MAWRLSRLELNLVGAVRCQRRIVLRPERHFASPLHSPMPHQRNAGSHAFKPGLKSPALLVLSKRFGQADEHILHHVFGIVPRTGEVIGETVQRHSKSGVQLPECLSAAVSRTLDEPGYVRVGRLCCSDRHAS